MYPKNLSNIFNSLQEINSKLTAQTNEFINADEAAIYLRLKKSYLYNLVYKNKIPFYKPSGKKLYFNKAELSQWITKSRLDTLEEFAQKHEQNSNTLPSLDK